MSIEICGSQCWPSTLLPFGTWLAEYSICILMLHEETSVRYCNLQNYCHKNLNSHTVILNSFSMRCPQIQKPLFQSYILKMDIPHSSKMLVSIHLTTQHHIPEGSGELQPATVYQHNQFLRCRYLWSRLHNSWCWNDGFWRGFTA
jgi:hypothetical protein